MRHEMTANMLHKAMNEVIKIQYVPFQPVTRLDSKLGIITNGLYQVHICTLWLRMCNCVTLQIGFIWVQRKQLKRGRPAVQAEGPSGVSVSITCTRTRRYAVWCSRTGSVWASCTCLVQLSCSRRGLCRSPFSCSRPGRWPTLSLEPGKAVKSSHVKFGNNCVNLINYF